MNILFIMPKTAVETEGDLKRKVSFPLNLFPDLIIDIEIKRVDSSMIRQALMEGRAKPCFLYGFAQETLANRMKTCMNLINFDQRMIYLVDQRNKVHRITGGYNVLKLELQPA